MIFLNARFNPFIWGHFPGTYLMRYLMLNFPCEFEIPDDWIAEAGIGNFGRRAAAYRSSDDARLIPLTQVAPTPRFNRLRKTGEASNEGDLSIC